MLTATASMLDICYRLLVLLLQTAGAVVLVTVCGGAVTDCRIHCIAAAAAPIPACWSL